MARSLKIRWLSALLGAALTISGVVLLAGQAASTPHLPSITPQQLLASMARAAEADRPISGDVTARLDLGLPSLPGQLADQAPGASAAISYLSGDHQVRVWHSADGVRVADLLTTGGRALFVSRRDGWAWDSQSFTAHHLGPFPGARERTTRGPRLPTTLPLDPNDIAERALQAITPTTSVSLGSQTRVAGRDAYVLVLEPRSSDTLVGRVEISVDGARRVPLGVQIFPRGSVHAAVSVMFTSVSFGAIKPSTFHFKPPSGARVVQVGHGLGSHSCYGPLGECGVLPAATLAPTGRLAPTVRGRLAFAAAQSVRVFGEGWSQVVAVRIPSPTTLEGGQQGDLLRQLLPFSGTLFSVRLVDRGDHAWLMGGFVPQSRLASLQAKLP